VADMNNGVPPSLARTCSSLLPTLMARARAPRQCQRLTTNPSKSVPPAYKLAVAARAGATGARGPRAGGAPVMKLRR